MSVKNYRFVSPGVFVNEIDNSQVPASPAGIGPVVIGRAASGPALRPVTIRSFEEFVNVFGTPAPGNAGGDVWREGTNKSSTTYGMYAAQAYLRNSSPLTYIRLLGANHDDADPDAAGNAGWKAAGDAYGLVVFEDDGTLSAASASVTCLDFAGAAGAVLHLTGSGGNLKLTAAATSATPGTVAIGASNDAFAAELAAVINISGSEEKLLATATDNVVTIKAVNVGAGGNSNSELTSSTATYWSVTGRSGDGAGTDTLHGFFGGGVSPSLDGALAAIFYSTETDTTFALSGAVADFTTITPADGVATASADAIVRAVGSNKEFKLVITDYKGTSDLTTTFNFTSTDSRYIRKVLNTNPQLTNTDTTDSTSAVKYFLGETFDRHLSANITSNGKNNTYASIVKIKSGANVGSNFKTPLKSAQTPNIISCRLAPDDAPVNLFHIEALEQPGDWSNRNIKISIQDIKRTTNDSTDYGTFSVVVRHLSDSDNVVRVIEQFNNCDLNPNSLNYVARKIGTQTRTWDSDDRRLKLEGDWPNNSSHIRIVMSTVTPNASMLPFGCDGILTYDNESFTSSSAGNWISSSAGGIPPSTDGIGPFWASGSALTASVFYPDPELRLSASDGGLSNKTDAYFGFQTTKTAGGTVFDRSTIDLLRPRGGIANDMFAAAVAGTTERSVVFTLDDVSGSGVWVPGSHTASSLTYLSGAVAGVLDAGYDRFSVPMYGGFDGVDIMDMDAFANNSFVVGADPEDCYVLNTFRRAIDTIADPETVEMSLASIPGLTHEGLTTHLVNTCEDRADALAIIDLPNAFVPREESTAVNRNNTAANITALVNGLRSRGLNSSYGCTYYPWVRARDTINGAFLWLPPSIPALGTLSSSQRKTQVWFAPAGFNRGGLTEGSAGIPVVDVAHQLRRKDRDDLYSANINPIAKFPAEGIVIFGQKTLQVTPSALDRINVRRLMIFIKKRISQIAAGLLFDPNVKQTWARFLSKVNPFLADVRTNFGLSSFRVVLDETTTTPDLIDRNILYAQIFLKPTRAIEFIAIDFNISRTGASFED